MQQRIKKLFVLSSILFSGGAAFSQTLITYGNSTVDKDEFLRAYNKNKPGTESKEKSMRDYVELYSNFKLKVKAAQELRLDTLSQIRYDTDNFRDQVMPNYLTDDKGLQVLTDEAIERAGRDLHVLYFSVPVAPNATPADTLKAFNTANDLYKELKNGNTAYADLVTNMSGKSGSQVKYNDGGFVTAFTLPYQYEDLIYKAGNGNVSAPLRTEKGWVIFKMTEERKDAGKWKTAQLLFAYPPNSDYNTKLAVKEKADSVYGLLKKGLSFSEAAKVYSDDRMTYLAGGELPEFTTGKYSADFEKNVFNLRNDNDITAPFETQFGYHIVKLLGHTSLPEKNDANYHFEMQQKVLIDPRMNREKEKFAREIGVKAGLKRTSVSDADMLASADTVVKHYGIDYSAKMPISKKTVISFKDGTQIKGEEWLKYVMSNTNAEQVAMPDKQMIEKFISLVAVNYYKKHLEEYNPDFKYQMQEFREGNMLFEIMERNVWSKAGADSAGLEKYYSANKEKYKWLPSADVVILNCTDEQTAAQALQSLKAGKRWITIAEESNNKIQADSGRYEMAQIPGGGIVNTQPGSYSDIIKNSDGSASVVKYLKNYDGGLQRSFTEARGLIINDYQNVLEQQWVATLRKKYPVKVNETILEQIIK